MSCVKFDNDNTVLAHIDKFPDGPEAEKFVADELARSEVQGNLTVIIPIIITILISLRATGKINLKLKKKKYKTS